MPRKKVESFIVQGREFRYVMDKNGCMIAEGHYRDKDGYPRVSYTHSKRKAIARLIYESIHGPWEPGKVMRHTCNNRACINPAHIIPGTQGQNMQDRAAAGKDPVGEKNGRAILDAGKVVEIRNERGKVSARTLAEQYGVNIGTIRDVWARKIWKHVA